MNIINQYIGDNNLETHIKHLYQFNIFRDILNVVLSLIIDKHLSFKVIDKRFSESQEGLCATSTTSFYHKVLNKIIYQRHHLVVIKKMSANVIIHECAHAIEKASGINLNENFNSAIHHDLNNLKDLNMILRNKINNLMMLDLKNYNIKSHLSELFARYFEVFASTREVVADGKFSIEDVIKIFLNTTQWIETALNPLLREKTNQEVISYSNSHPTITSNTFNWQNKVNNKPQAWRQRTNSLFH